MKPGFVVDPVYLNAYNPFLPHEARVVSVAQLAEHQTVALAVVGSIPITHPIFYAPVAQGIERRPPEPGAEVRFLPGAPLFCVALLEGSKCLPQPIARGCPN